MNYQPPYTITPAIVNLVAEIGEIIGRYTVLAEQNLTPRLRRENRILTIQASLAIENNTLTLEQVTAVIEGKRVLGHPREIQEVRNAFATYEAMEDWNASVEEDLLAAHELLMRGLVDETGRYRSGGVAIFRGEQLVHMAPPADRVPKLMADLLDWLENTNEHPLVASCIVHYEFEFIHPFTDGNGRMGRLWQSLILACWNPLFADIPVESLIFQHQAEYYQVLQESTQQTDSEPFIAFMLRMILDTVTTFAPQVSPQVTPQVGDLLATIQGEMGREALQSALGLSDRKSFRERYLKPALADGLIKMTIPDKPNSRLQKYRLTDKGRQWLAQNGDG
jgi:Fic family protein